MDRKLGKKPQRLDSRTLQLRKYIDAAKLPVPPNAVDWTAGIKSWGMMGNDVLGDCTCAAVGHAVQGITASSTGDEITPSTADVELMYRSSGWDPNDPASDNGWDMLSALNYWRKTGLAGHKILAFAQVNPQNPYEVRTAQYLFGGAYTGVGLPIQAQSQVGSLWNISDGLSGNGAPNTWGGHCIWLPKGKKSKGPGPGYSCVTWGALQDMTVGWLNCYCDEMYAVLTMDWVGQAGKCPPGFDLAQLITDLKQV